MKGARWCACTHSGLLSSCEPLGWLALGRNDLALAAGDLAAVDLEPEAPEDGLPPQRDIAGFGYFVEGGREVAEGSELLFAASHEVGEDEAEETGPNDQDPRLALLGKLADPVVDPSDGFLASGEGIEHVLVVTRFALGTDLDDSGDHACCAMAPLLAAERGDFAKRQHSRPEFAHGLDALLGQGTIVLLVALSVLPVGKNKYFHLHGLPPFLVVPIGC